MVNFCRKNKYAEYPVAERHQRHVGMLFLEEFPDGDKIVSFGVYSYSVSENRIHPDFGLSVVDGSIVFNETVNPVGVNNKLGAEIEKLIWVEENVEKLISNKK